MSLPAITCLDDLCNNEGAALPRRLTVLPALPLTAIGKVCNPTLRLLTAVFARTWERAA